MALEPGTIILDHGANPPTFWVVKSKTKLVAVLDDGSVLHADFKGKLWKGATAINNRSLAWDVKLRHGGHGVTIGSEWVSGEIRLKVKDLLRDGKVVLEVLERPEGHGWTVGLTFQKSIEELRQAYELEEKA